MNPSGDPAWSRRSTIAALQQLAPPRRDWRTTQPWAYPQGVARRGCTSVCWAAQSSAGNPTRSISPLPRGGPRTPERNPKHSRPDLFDTGIPAIRPRGVGTSQSSTVDALLRVEHLRDAASALAGLAVSTGV